MGQYVDSKGRILSRLLDRGIFNAEYTDVVANTGSTLSQVSIDLNALKGSAASNAAFQSALANTNVKLAQLESNLLSTNTAIRSFVSTEVSNLVDSAPDALNTLNELAAALGDDENFATTLTTNLSQKLGSTATVALTGDATASGAFSANAVSLAVTLADSGVSAGSYGNTTAIATFTVDSKGRITDVTEVAVGGVETVSFAAANDTLSVVLSDGRVLTADFTSFTTEIGEVQSALDAQIATQVAAQEENETRLDAAEADIVTLQTELDAQETKQAGDLANTNAFIATVETDLAIQSAKQASDLANTNAYIASTVGDVDTLRSELYATNTAIRTYVDEEVAALVDAAPEALDTLNELAAALGDDENFASTLTTNLSQKLGATASVTLVGEVTGTANFSANAVSIETVVAPSGVVANTYGSASLIPVVTVGSDGRITSVTTQSVAGVTGASYEASNNTITITTADGSEFDATITDLKEIAEAAAELANTNTRVAVVEQNVAQKLGATASVELTGDATASGSFSANAVSLAVTLADTGVSAGSYGSASEIPVVTVDSKGRITSLSTTTVAGVDGFAYETSNNTFTITTADGGVFNATITDLEEVSDALAKLANTNAFIATVESELDTQKAKQASDLANTNAYIASVDTKVDTVDAGLLAANNRLDQVISDLDAQEAKQAVNLANTNARIAVTEQNIIDLGAEVDSNLANTNAYIASVASDLDTQEAKQASDLANTNAYVASVSGDVDTLRSELYSTNTAIRTYIDEEVSALVDGAPELLDTLNELAAAIGDDENFATTLTTNLGQKLGASATVTLIGDATGSASFSANAVTITVDVPELEDKTDETTALARLANTNAYIASVESDLSTALDTQEAKQASDLANTNAYIASVESDLSTALDTQEAKQASDLANTNAYIASVASDLDTQEAKQASDLANTNAYIATVDTRVATQESKQASNLANTNAYIASVDAQRASDLANTNAYIESTVGDLDTLRSELYSTNTAIRTYIDEEVAALVDAAPEALDTLNELAAALGDDANFVTTVTTNLGQKLGGTASVALTGDATASGNFSANAISLAVTLANTGVTSGTYGSGTTVPRFTVDAKGRITGVSEVNVGGVDSLAFASANDTLSVVLSDGRTLDADFSSFTTEIEAVQSALDTQEAKQASDLANTNASIASVASDLDTQEAKQASDLANTNAYIATVEGDLATQTAKQASDLANTNTRIAATEDRLDTVESDLDAQEAKQASDLANTNARVATVESDVTTLRSELYSTNTAIRTYIDEEVAALVDAAPEALDTLNELAAALGDDANFVTTVTTNLGQRLGSSATVTLTGDATGTGSFSANAVTITVDVPELDNKTDEVDALARLANTNAYIASVASDLDTQEAKQASDLANTNAYIASVAADLDTQEAKQTSDLANTNARIATTEGRLDTVESDLDTQEAKQASDLANTNAYIASVDGKVDTLRVDTNTLIGAVNTAIATVASDLDTQEAKQASDLANTNAYIASVASDLDTQEAKQASDLANTNAYIASTVGAVDTLRTELYATNTAIRTYVDEEVAALVDGAPELLDTLNELAAAIGDDANFATTITTNLGQKLGATATVTLAGDITGTASFSANAVTVTTTDTNLANTNAYIATVNTRVATQESKQASDLANTNAYIATIEGELDTQVAKQASDLANTNAYIATVEGDLATQTAKQASDLANTNLFITSVQSTLNTQITKQATDLANTNAQIITLDTKVDSNLANTNSKLINIESNLLATNTAIRALIPDEIGFSEYVFTATQGQTAFTGTDDNGRTFSYTEDKVSVFLNGVMLVKGVDYVLTNSTTITLDDAAEADDVLTVQAHEVANYVSKQGDVSPVSQTVAADNTAVDTFGTGDYRTVKYLVQATDSTANEYESMEVMVLHNGSTVQLVEYASLQTSGSLVTLDADIFGGNVRLLASPSNNNVTVKAIRLAVSA